jgi:hypothetical protein
MSVDPISRSSSPHPLDRPYARGGECESGILQEDADGISQIAHIATSDDINDSNVGNGVSEISVGD